LTVVGICAALPQEARAIAGLTPRVGDQLRLPGGHLLAVAGMGAARARMAGMRLLDAGATALISWGTVGALAPGVDAGTLVIPVRVVDSCGQVFITDEAWRQRMLRRANGRLLRTTPGLLAQAGQVIRTPGEKRDLHQRLGAVAVDMESAALAEVAREAAVPFIVVRAVTDTARMSIPGSVMHAMDPAGRIHLRRLLSGVLCHPADMIALVRLAKGYRAAAAALTTFAGASDLDFLPPCPAASA
jgi:adenosylhomocysteine nucleosidase